MLLRDPSFYVGKGDTAFVWLPLARAHAQGPWGQMSACPLRSCDAGGGGVRGAPLIMPPAVDSSQLGVRHVSEHLQVTADCSEPLSCPS